MRCFPELSDRRVLVDARGPIDGETVAAQRPITLHDVLTLRLGMGMNFAAPWPQPFLEVRPRKVLSFAKGEFAQTPVPLRRLTYDLLSTGLRLVGHMRASQRSAGVDVRVPANAVSVAVIRATVATPCAPDHLILRVRRLTAGGTSVAPMTGTSGCRPRAPHFSSDRSW
jgi:hypothetical protein